MGELPAAGYLEGERVLEGSRSAIRTAAFSTLLELVRQRAGVELLGDDRSLAEEAFEQSLIGFSFPSFWLEVPLAGEAGFDLHVYYDRGQVKPGARFAPGCGFGMQSLFDWYFGDESGGVGVGFAHDLRGGHIACGAYVNCNARPLENSAGFFAALGRPEVAADAQALMGRLGVAWSPWYLGLFPHRAGTPCRLGMFVSRRRQGAYQTGGPAFADDLARVGFAATDGQMLRCVRELASLPYGLELRLDTTEGGGTGDTLAVDLMVPRASAKRVRASFADGGPGARACALLEGWASPTGAGAASRTRRSRTASPSVVPGRPQASS